MGIFGIRDKANYLIHWVESKDAATEYIKKHDPKGLKGYHVIIA